MSAWPAAFARLRESSLPRILFVTHAHGGGLERHVMELAAAVEGRAETLRMRPVGTHHVALQGFGDDAAVFLDKQAEWPALVAILQGLGIDRIHFHHVHGFPADVLALPAALGCPYDVTLHDYFPVCLNYHLADGDGAFCGGHRDCLRCLEAAPDPWGLGIPGWRERFATFLQGAARCIAPSKDCAARIRDHIPGLEVETWPHPRAAGPLPSPVVRVLVPGGISREKGLGVLERCARDAQARGLPLHFRVLGFTAWPLPQWPALPVTLSGEYPEGKLPELLAAEHGDVAFFPAQIPETFSYTLTDVLDRGLPVVATDLGALPERLARYGQARILRRTASAREFNEALLASAISVPTAGERQVEMGFDGYAARYLAGLPTTGRAPASLPTLRDDWLAAPVLTDPPTTTLAWLFQDGVRAGKASSLAKLERRAAEADACLEAQPGHAAALAAACADAESLRASTSWRLTAPLRALVTRFRGRSGR
jgi:glycosyltransferase involved in cell wall biosynthesis